MLKNYLKLTWRNLVRNSTYSIIILSGLVLAYSSCLIIFLFVENELSYDRQAPDSDRIYRVCEINVDDDGPGTQTPTSPSPLGPAILDDLSQVESATRMTPTWNIKALVTGGTKSFHESKIVGADSTFIKFFGFKVIAGNPEKPFKDGQSMVLTESTARKYFDSEDPIGKTVKVAGVPNLVTVTGVIADMPHNMHFHFDIIVPLWEATHIDERWEGYNYFTYIKIREGSEAKEVEAQVVDVFHKHRPDNPNGFFLQPLEDIHLQSDMKFELERNGDKTFVTIFITIGIFIFLIAAVNYVNLSIVQALNRSKEVGVRKVSGALSRELIDQFLLESTLISLAALVVAIMIVQGLVPAINALFNQHLTPLFSLSFLQLFIVVATAALAGVLSGLYPAVYLSAFNPAIVLKGMMNPGSGSAWLRKALVVLQFSISIALITGAALVFMQMDYLRSKELGFDKDQVVIVENIAQMQNKRPLKEALLKVNGVEAVGASSGVLGKQISTSDLHSKGIGLRSQMNYDQVDEDFLSAIGVELIAGRNFNASDVSAGPSMKIILNERAAMELGIDDNPVGAMVTQNPFADSVIYHEVIGVVKDFHYMSLRSEIRPYAFYLNQSYFSNFAVRVNSTDYKQVIEDMSKVWDAHGSGGAFEYFFVDDQFENLYRAEENFQLIFFILTIISIYIACSGLFAVASYFIKRKTKEIGIRKALGASVEQVTWLVSRGFLRMVLLANLIAWPVTWTFMNDWLNGFAYRIEMNWMIFLISGVTALMIAVITIGGQSVRAAQSNPIESLRNE